MCEKALQPAAAPLQLFAHQAEQIYIIERVVKLKSRWVSVNGRSWGETYAETWHPQNKTALRCFYSFIYLLKKSVIYEELWIVKTHV